MSGNDPVNVLLARIDERTRAMEEKIEALNDRIDEDRTGFVTRKEFDPVRVIVYGFVGLTMATVVGSLIALVVRGGR